MPHVSWVESGVGFEGGCGRAGRGDGRSGPPFWGVGCDRGQRRGWSLPRDEGGGCCPCGRAPRRDKRLQGGWVEEAAACGRQPSAGARRTQGRAGGP